MNRRDFLKAALAGTVLAGGATAAPKAPPNVLFIAVDEPVKTVRQERIIEVAKEGLVVIIKRSRVL